VRWLVSQSISCHELATRDDAGASFDELLILQSS
jgi:hypothetical protein